MPKELSVSSCSQPSGRTAAAIERTVDHIRENFSERINLEDLAAIAQLSVFRFVTVFRRQVGLPPHRYLNHVRVLHAKALLGSGIPPAIVAIEAGFFDQSHLSRHFKSICGMTPGQYLSQIRGAQTSPSCERRAGSRRAAAMAVTV